MCPSCHCTEWDIMSDSELFECRNCRKQFATSQMIIGADFYVYQFVNDDWGVPFFVGKGTRDRYKTLKGRNARVITVCNNFAWHPEIVKYCSSESDAYNYEKQLKDEYRKRGYPILDAETATASGAHIQAQREGIKRAKREGKYKGGKPKIIPPAFNSLYHDFLRRDITKSDMARRLGCSRPTLDKWINNAKQIYT